MCGIVGAILAEGSVVQSLVEGLRVLEYRGYDSSGVAVARETGIQVRKRQGRLAILESELADGALDGALAGVGHTRWATHGPPSDRNAHPHLGDGGAVAVVHNGIIENYLTLKEELGQAGVKFESDTDTEVLAHLIARELAAAPSLAEAVRRSLKRVDGYYALAVLTVGENGPEVVCARQGPPLAITSTADAAYLASDLLGLLPYSNHISFLEDGDLAILTPGKVQITDLDGKAVERLPKRVDWDPGDSGLGHWPHHMLKEIHEQPDVLARTAFGVIDMAEGDVRFGDGGLSNEFLKDVERVQVVACGTALHAGMIASYLIEGLAKVPVDVDFASEFRYRDPIIVPNTMALAVTQSGETADTLAASRLAREKGAKVAAICNVAGSSQVRESDACLLTQAGPEIGVASTKAFTAQVT
ncbi:MAG: glutamine--fructose-6-phosphate transaminase (isomerizing), partial [Planctomycetota bacterium]|nr:glutamine--fructose-6-phosphate transaminase (isomerizing) [Planctomycetota bacterium]